MSTIGFHVAIGLVLPGWYLVASGNVAAILCGDRFEPVRTPTVESLNQASGVSLPIVAAQNGAMVRAESVRWVD